MAAVNFRIPDALHDDLRKLAEQHDRSLNEQMVLMLRSLASREIEDQFQRAIDNTKQTIQMLEETNQDAPSSPAFILYREKYRAVLAAYEHALMLVRTEGHLSR